MGDYILGLDIGSGSIGWAMIRLEGNESVGVERLGVRRFEAGVQGDIEGGKDESRAIERRSKRGPRRQIWRRQWRQRKVYRLLQANGLLPNGDGDSPDARHKMLMALDAELRATLFPNADRVITHLLPYKLRTMALDETTPLPPHALGRAFFHLAQRRGFLSNRKAQKEDDDERGAVKQGIADLDKLMHDAGARTIGEYFAGLDPEAEKCRIRARWTARRMFLDEFEKIWKAQAPHHAALTDEFKAELHHALFFQRKLKSQRGLIGRCELVPERRRAPIACLPAQRIRLLQKVNDLKVICPDGEIRSLTSGERTKLLDELMIEDQLSFAAIRKLLGLNKKSKEYGRGFTFNFEEGDEKLIGNRTAAKMRKVLGGWWDKQDEMERAKLVDEILAFESEEALAARLQRAWNFDLQTAERVAGVVLESTTHSLSRRAIRKLLPLMETGTPFATARQEIYGERLVAKDPVDRLPPVLEANPQLRNPAVCRALTELRKIINAVVREFGKPVEIHVELARDLKHARERRKKMADRMKENEKFRDKAKNKILEQLPESFVSEENKLKVRLADECNWECPFTGRPINLKQLCGSEPQFDIEHIIPFSRSFDNSFANKTLCYHEENRHVKRDRSPFNAYGETDRWPEILERVRRFQGGLREVKLEKFQERDSDLADFTERQLNDTRYASRLAAEYVGLLYGGQVDSASKRRVQASPGRVTAYLRQRWKLNSLIGHADEKNRADHRHHAIDALVIALSNASSVKKLSQAAEEAERRGLRLFADINPPIPDLLDQARDAVDAIQVSSRVSRKLNGSLHEDTNLSPPRPGLDKKGKPAVFHHVRKRLEALSEDEVENIVDDRVRELVKEKLDKLGVEPKKAFQDPAQHPYMIAKDGRLIPIHKARIHKAVNPITVGDGPNRRYVSPGSNHHMEIVAHLDDQGQETKWEGILVSRFEASQRKRRKQKIIQLEHGEKRQFKFSLAGGEHLRFGGDRLCRVLAISENEVECVFHTDARPATVRRKSKEKDARLRFSPEKLRKSDVKKVVVSPVGEICVAND